MTVNGGIIHNVFGGNDISGVISGDTNVTLPEGSTAEVEYAVYGGGRNADYEAGTAHVSVAGGTISSAYGGGYAAVTGKTKFIITGGKIETAYGGGNAATVTGSADIEVDSEINKCVETLFAGNNQAEMDIEPNLNFKSGEIGTFYGGGNEGVMTKEDGLAYEMNFPNIKINTVYAGCNNTPEDKVTADVAMTLAAGTYGTVFGGNNVNGHMKQTHVIVDGEPSELTVETVYGGGNQADSLKTLVDLQKGYVKTAYGGGNEATVTESVSILVGKEENGSKTGDASAGTLYCGNNEAAMAIRPAIDLQKGEIENFYAGGNAGDMTYVDHDGYTADYTFESDGIQITNLFGGCNQADMQGSVKLNLAGAKAENVYGGCNTSGTVPKAEILVSGDGTTSIYGGGYGASTHVIETAVHIQNGVVGGNVYGGSGFGHVKDANVLIQEDNSTGTTGRIQIKGSVYGGGYGVSSVTETADVQVNMKLDIMDKNDQNANDADLLVEEGVIDSIDSNDEVSSGETQTKVSWNAGKENAVSRIEGNVYGGGDMGKVGDGHINPSSNTADIYQAGHTKVNVTSGYIKGSVFGGGSGMPKENLNYTIYMGTVFGSCETTVNGGYISGSIYGCGYQSRVYAAEQDGTVRQAAIVNIQEEASDNEIVIGTSVFGGGNKGERTSQNASVYTVIGDTTVNIAGLDNQEATAIYFLSANKGGVYGDGNLCLVQGTRTVNLENFHEGTEYNKLKTFYSLQRADVVNLDNSRIVLEGAKDLVDETADDTLYAINRVSQLNMNHNSSLKLTTIVNLLGGLKSDQNTEKVYIDKGNNGSNNYTDRGGEEPSDELTEDQIAAYRQAYANHLANENVDGDYSSFNVVCVANGRYLEIKKNDSEYGNVTGLFTLELLHANPGEGGGFVYANIGAKGDTENPGSTGDFICVTRNDEGDSSDYMEVYDNVGGLQTAAGGAWDYTWYYWYIKGGKYTYDVYLNGYIGTTETSFTETITLPEMREDYYYFLHSVTGEAPTEAKNELDKFNTERLQDFWNETENSDEDEYAIELQVVAEGRGNKEDSVLPIGYLGYDAEKQDESGNTTGAWYIKYNEDLPSGETDIYQDNAGQKVYGTGDDNNNEQAFGQNVFYGIMAQTTGLQLRLVLHKGSGVDVEIRDVKVALTFDVLPIEDVTPQEPDSEAEDGSGDDEQGGMINGSDTSQLLVNTHTSITRIVPTQVAYLSSGRLYAGVSSDAPAKITSNSVFTAQFITKYVPSAFNHVNEKLTAAFAEKYLLDKETGIGYTITEDESGNVTLKYATLRNPNEYTVTKDANGGYQVTKYGEDSDEYTHELQCEATETSSFTFPKGTTISLVAKMDDCDNTYWYYYCTKDMQEIPLADFVQMNTQSQIGTKYSFENASEGLLSHQSSNRITENLTFVFDFANVAENETAWWDENSPSDTVLGRLQLKHETTIGSYQNADIMDYVAEKTDTSGADPSIIYTRAHPAVSNYYEVSKNKTGIDKFGISLSDNKEVYYVRDTYGIRIEIVEDPEYVNTRYDEREYAVMLELTDTEDPEKPEVLPFPEGAVFLYGGQTLAAGVDNKSVIIPVKTAGVHSVEIRTGLEAFDAGTVTIRAKLYSSSVANYYNELETDTKPVTVEINTVKNPEYALRIDVQGSGSGEDTGADASEIAAHLAEPGETLSLTIQGQDGGSVSAELYKYSRSDHSYEKLAWTEVFEDAEADILLNGGRASWSPTVADDAPRGTYRLEFVYHDKTEYWDFIVE